MNITQLWHRIALSLGGLSLAGIGAAVTWLWSLRKVNAEIKEIKQRMAKAERGQLVERLTLLLVRRAECLDPNQNWLTKAGWAGLLPDNANLIDEVLVALQRDNLLESSETGLYKIGYKSTIGRRRA